MQITPASLAALQQGFNAAFQQGFAGTTPSYDLVAMTVPSTARAETYGWMKDMPGMREWVGPRVINNLEAQAAELVNKTYEHTIGVSVDDIEDDRLGLYNTRFAQQGEVARRHPDSLVWGALRSGFEAKGFDGKTYFGGNHTTCNEKGKEVAWSNLIGSGSGPAWFLMDLSRSFMKPLIFQNRMSVQQIAKTRADDDAVFIDNQYLYGCKARYVAGFGFHQLAVGSKDTLNATNFEAALLALSSQKRPDGSPLGVRATHLVCGPSSEGKARTLLLKQNLAGGEDNIWFNAAQMHVSAWLD